MNRGFESLKANNFITEKIKEDRMLSFARLGLLVIVCSFECTHYAATGSDDINGVNSKTGRFSD